jgi:hypothetical protein
MASDSCPCRSARHAIMAPMISKLKEVLERAQAWPEADQAELAEYAQQIERRHGADYRPTAEELQAIDEADRSGVASEGEVEAAFRTFRPA